MSVFSLNFLNVWRNERSGGALVLQAFQLSELLHQLFHSVPTKLYCKLGIFPIAFAREDDALAVFGMPHARPFAQPGLARGCRNVQLRPRRKPCPAGFIARSASPALAKELRNIVQRPRPASRFI